MATKAPIQSNVCDFEEVLGSQLFLTPRNSLNSSVQHTPRTLLKKTTIINDDSTTWKRSPNMSDPSSSKGKSALIHEKCRTPVQANSQLSPTLSSVEDYTKDFTKSIHVFQPEFLSKMPYKSSKNEENKWETVRAITETIIREKDMLIERQKLKRLQLEQQVRELESKIRKITLTQVEALNHKTDLEKEEIAYKQLVSSAQALSENTTLAKVVLEKSQLERQLGEYEHQIADLKCSLLTSKSEMQQQIDYYKKQFTLSQQQETALKSRTESIKSEEQYAVKELSRLKLYLAELPTKEEHNQLISKLEEAEQKLQSAVEHMDQLSTDKSEIQSEYSQVKAELKESNEQVDQLLNQVAILQKEVSSWEAKEAMRSRATDDDIVRLKENHEQLYADYDEATKMLEEQDRKMEALSKEYEDKLRDISERLDQSESAIQTAQAESQDREEHIRTLTSYIKQLKQENLDLTEKVVSWESKIKVANEVTSSETVSLERSLVEDIVYCTNNLECLLDICTNSKSIDLADMIATRPTPVTISSPREYMAVLEEQSRSLKSVNAKVEKMRQYFIEKYADDMAADGNVDCTMQ